MESELEKIAFVYGDVCVRRRKLRKKRRKLLVIELLYDYAKNSTLHGLRYIVDQGLNIVERLFWFLTVIASILLCSFYIYNVVQKWYTSPVIVTVNGRLSSVGSVPFPSVTICPRMKVNPHTYNYTEKMEMFINRSLPKEEVSKFLHVSSMCDNFYYQIGENYTDPSIVNDIVEAAPSFNDVFFMCVDGNTNSTDCKSLFSKVITREGVCYTTNSLAASDIFEDTIQSNYAYMDADRKPEGWSLEEGYNYSYEHVYPRQGNIFGTEADLSIVMIHNPGAGDKNCNKLYAGYMIYLHHPADFPQSSLYYYAAIPDQLSSVAISFHEFNSDSDIKRYNANIRQCYFPSDRKLRYFKIYTTTNCQAECLSNYTLKMCKCVGFYMPRLSILSMNVLGYASRYMWSSLNITASTAMRTTCYVLYQLLLKFAYPLGYVDDDSTKICQPHYDCMVKAKVEMARLERCGDLGLRIGECQCLPACNTVEYDAEILKTEYRIEDYLQDIATYVGYSPLTKYSKIDLFYKKSQFVTMQRRELFGFTDLLANIGGLLGLFLGFSFLSLIEIFYFVTVRVGFILRRDLVEEKAKAKSKLNNGNIK